MLQGCPTGLNGMAFAPIFTGMVSAIMYRLTTQIITSHLPARSAPTILNLFPCSIIQTSAGMGCLKIYILYAVKIQACLTIMEKTYGAVKKVYRVLEAKQCRALKPGIH